MEVAASTLQLLIGKLFFIKYTDPKAFDTSFNFINNNKLKVISLRLKISLNKAT